MTNIDYSAARVVRELQQELQSRGTTLLVVHAESSLLADMRRHHLSEVIGDGNVFETLQEALATVNARGPRLAAVPKSTKHRL